MGVWSMEVWGCGASESELYLSNGNFEVPTGKQRQELQETYESLEIRQDTQTRVMTMTFAGAARTRRMRAKVSTVNLSI